mmetsp:Transcript_43766/g.115027  ORF Transcript_43766/g.115027 Transcript_43766/m.115027 type:complete len:226 (+) Transcript_43766:175-852(+)
MDGADIIDCDRYRNVRHRSKCLAYVSSETVDYIGSAQLRERHGQPRFGFVFGFRPGPASLLSTVIAEDAVPSSLWDGSESVAGCSTLPVISSSLQVASSAGGASSALMSDTRACCESICASKGGTPRGAWASHPFAPSAADVVPNRCARFSAMSSCTVFCRSRPRATRHSFRRSASVFCRSFRASEAPRAASMFPPSPSCVDDCRTSRKRRSRSGSQSSSSSDDS